MDKLTKTQLALEATIAALKGTLPTMDDARQDAASKVEDSANWNKVVQAYDYQIQDIKDTILLAEGILLDLPGQPKVIVNFTVRDLIRELFTHDPDRVVVMSKDSEGNNYSPLSSIEDNSYHAESTFSGHTSLEELTPELAKYGYSEEDVESDGVPCVTFYPTW